MRIPVFAKVAWCPGCPQVSKAAAQTHAVVSLIKTLPIPIPISWVGNGTGVVCASFCPLAFVPFHAARSLFLLCVIYLENERPVILTEGS